jgi:hypothetical protein
LGLSPGGNGNVSNPVLGVYCGSLPTPCQLQAGNFNGVATLAGALDRNIEAAARLSGEWPADEVPRSITNNIVLSDVAQLLQILKPYPDAAKAIVDYYRARPADKMIEHVDTAAD